MQQFDDATLDEIARAFARAAVERWLAEQAADETPEQQETTS